ncbi:MAG: UDP-N-acetylglucosamine 1-carboxyvinyltransferase, partial [bacterium]
MEKLVIEGNKPLTGEVPISGAKNAALPIMAATILSTSPCQLTNVPQLNDIYTMCKLLREMGLEVSFDENTVQVDARPLHSISAPYELVKKMRASVLVLGPLLGREGEAKVSLPGGCAIGTRPIDLHLSGFEAMGADITLEEG